METINEEMQMIAVEKVLEEMKYAEEFVMKWNSSWYEKCSDCYSSTLYKLGINDIDKLEKKYFGYYDLQNISIKYTNTYPLKKVILTDCHDEKHECEFGRIDWYGMNSHKSSRRFSFDSSGNIIFEKSSKETQDNYNSKKSIFYKCKYNVLSNNFNITVDEIISKYEKDKNNYYTISLMGNILIEKLNNIEIIREINTGMKLIKIVKKYDKQDRSSNVSVVFDAVLNPDDSLEMGAVAIKTHKGNGKVNGTYRFHVSRKKGIRANFYSRKGVKVDLTTNPMLLGFVNTLLLPSSNIQNNGDLIISDFANSTQNAISKNLTEKVISFDNSDFNMDSVKQAESRILEMIKCIKGELPLSGLVERIDNCISILEAQKREKIKEKAKILKLESKN